MPELKVFDYSVAPHSESVVVVAGGWSTRENRKRVRSYISSNNSVVFAANYNYKIPAHYTYFTDYFQFKKQVNNIKSPIIVRPQLQHVVRKAKTKKAKEYYVVKLQDDSSSIYGSSRVQINSDGSFPYNLIGTAGMASIVVSLLCKPKRILLVGFDGSSNDASVKKMFDGSVVKYGKPSKRIKEVNYLTNSLMPTLHELGITVETFESVLFYGIPKEKLGITVI